MWSPQKKTRRGPGEVQCKKNFPEKMTLTINKKPHPLR